MAQSMMQRRVMGPSATGNQRPRQHAVKPCQAVATPSANVAASNKVRLGDSELMVSECCLGTMTWGRQNTEAEAHEQLSYAFDMGINWMDTAEMYPVPGQEATSGTTDRYIGRWLKSRKREDVIVATKVSGYSEQSVWMREPRQTLRINREQVLQSVENSLKRLQIDHIDLLQLHVGATNEWPDRYVPLFGGGQFEVAKIRPGAVPFEEQLEALQELIKAGKVRHVGVSNETSYGVSEFLHAAKTAGLPKIVSIQNAYSLLNRGQYETNLAETCHYGNVGLMAYSPLAGGSLSGKYNHGDQPKSRFNLFPGYMARYNASLVKEAVGEYEKVAAKHGLTCTELALAWCKSRWFVTSTIIGATSMDQLKENITAFNKELSPDCVADVEAVFKKYRDPTLL